MSNNFDDTQKCFYCGEESHINNKSIDKNKICIKCNNDEANSEIARTIIEELLDMDNVSLKEAKEIIHNREVDSHAKDIKINVLLKADKENKEKISSLKSEIKKIRATKGWQLLERLRRMKKYKLGAGKIGSIFRKIDSSIKQVGLKDTLIKILNKLLNRHGDRLAYEAWIRTFEPSEIEIANQRDDSEKFSYRPLISILVPTYETDKKMLIEMIESVIYQTYGNWELCIADGNSKDPNVKEVLDAYKQKDNRIKVKYLEDNKGIIGNSNEALDMCTGDYISLLDHDDTLAPFALYEIVKVINEEKADFIYSDEDKINRRGDRRYFPHFKPDWSPDTLRSYNYITHLVTIKEELLRGVGGFRVGFEGSQDHDLILRATSAAEKISHISKILYHWRAHENSVAGSGEAKLYAFESGKRAVEQNLVDSNIPGLVQDGLFSGSYRPIYIVEGNPKVAIIIPNKDKAHVLKTCVESILKFSTYINYEIIIVENSSSESRTFEYYKSLEANNKVKVIEFKEKFNYSAVNNFATKFTDAEYYLFLNNDVEIITTDWIEAMLEHAQRKDVGVVGAKLMFKNDTIQHAGVVVGMHGWADHICAHLSELDIESKFYCKYLVDTIRNTSAVTGACMMIAKEKFDEVGGFNEDFILCGSDVEICLKLLKRNKVNVYTPFAKLYHYESLTRKNIDIPEVDFKYSYQAYKEYIFSHDPYYNENFDYRKNIPTLLTEKLDLKQLNPFAKEERNE